MRASLALVMVMALTRAGCLAESHLPEELTDAGPADAVETLATEPESEAEPESEPEPPRIRPEPTEPVGELCARLAETCFEEVEGAADGCELRRSVAVEHRCEAHFEEWANCLLETCDADVCNASRDSRCF